VSRFYLSPDANRDLDEIESYLDSLPREPAIRGGSAIMQTLLGIADHPYQGAAHSTLSRILGMEVRSRLTFPYRIYYRLDKNAPEVIAILHMARDTRSILIERFQ